LNKTKLSGHDETASSIMRITVAFSDGNFRLQETFRQPVLIHPRTAMRWNPEESIASFVESTSPEIVAEKDRIESVIPQDLAQDPLAFPAAAFHAMRQLAYSADPIHPHRTTDIDFVQFPLETLRRKRGDCDDLAIVYASLLEAAGIRSALLLTPGHVLVAFETPIPIHGAHAIIPQGMDFIRREGVVWIPVESTKVGASFSEAWTAATKELSKSTPKLIALSDAWKSYPPTNLAAGGAMLAEIKGEDVKRELSAVRPDPKVMLEAAAAISGATAKEHDRRGVLFAKAGDMAEARKHFEAGLKVDPAYTPAMIHLANLELMDGKFSEALKRYELALKRAPKSVEACLNAVIAARLSGDNQSLAKYMDRCEAQPGFADVEEYLGRSRPEQVGLPSGGRVHLPVWLDGD
jgi:tetratricopeptide (TPR) repeat protein